MVKYFASNNLLETSVSVGACNLILINGFISGDVVWNYGKVLVFTDVYVEANASLTIVSGTVIEIHGHYSITVKGTLIVQGGDSNQVVFTIK
ncbi:hypothetical protein [Labilibaculum euxinus]